jgi:hypothetical protein
MNFLFLTQSKTLEVFYRVMRALDGRTDLGKVGFYIADSTFYDTFKEQSPEISSGSFTLLKEWEILEKSIHIQPDISRLKGYEEALGDPFLWNAVVADRRIYLGKKATMEQDYFSRFDHERVLAILQVGLEEMEGMFDRVKPDAVIGFICVTIGEYLAYLIARARNIPFFDLRPTRIKNYFHAGDGVLEPSRRLEEAYRKMLLEGIPDTFRQEVSSYLSEVRETHAMYEGVLPPPGTASSEVIQEVSGSRRTFARKISSLARRYYDYSFGQYRHDNHHKGVLYPIWFRRIKEPARIRVVAFCLKRRYVSAQRLALLEYAFYPLHKEPEVTLLVYGRPYLNQIEVIRNLARSLPIGMNLVVKEHPAALGYRSLSYYRKLLAIPNILLAPPEMTSRELIQNARLVTIIGGSVGLEAIIMKKPVVALGRVPFSFFPDTMVRYIREMDNLGWEIRDLLENYQHDEGALIAYVAAVIKESVPIDFYSRLLGRRGIFGPTDASVNEVIRTEQIDSLADYILETYSARETRNTKGSRQQEHARMPRPNAPGTLIAGIKGE